jgi:hypothetical protein
MIELFTIASAIISFLSIIGIIKSRVLIFWLLVILLLIFDGLRWEMGTDWNNYYDIFMLADTYVEMGKPPGFEYGYIYYNSLIRFFTDNYSYFLFITTAFIYIGIFFAVAKITNYSLLSLFYLFSTLPWYSGSLRQMMASVFFVFAIKAVIDRKIYVFFACIIAGVFFHNSIIVFIPIYFLYGLSATILIFIYGFLVLISVYSRQLIYILDYLLSFYTDRTYSHRIGGTLAQSSPVLGMTRKILTVIGVYFFVHYTIYMKNIDPYYWDKIKFLLFLVFLSPIFYYIGTYHISYVSSRLDIYVGILSLAMLIGVLDTTLKITVNRIFLFFFVIALSAVFYYRLEYMSLFHPYSSIFYNFELHRELF